MIQGFTCVFSDRINRFNLLTFTCFWNSVFIALFLLFLRVAVLLIAATIWPYQPSSLPLLTSCPCSLHPRVSSLVLLYSSCLRQVQPQIPFTDIFTNSFQYMSTPSQAVLLLFPALWLKMFTYSTLDSVILITDHPFQWLSIFPNHSLPPYCPISHTGECTPFVLLLPPLGSASPSSWLTHFSMHTLLH